MKVTDHRDGGITGAPELLRSGTVAAEAGVNHQTLRYYERRGLVAEPDRTLGGHRLYPAETVTILRVIKAAQRLGFTLDEVGELIATGRHQHRGGQHRGGQHRGGQHRGGGSAGSGLQARAAAKLAEVEARIADLVVIRGTLRAAVEAGCDDLSTCAECPNCPLPFAALAGADGHAL